ncbi:unnamed protein product [Cercopithifilaria johnstoni]|uniref:Uncharacterized protein n=1 Tax=Cercopithifilaria johnstoni TaxID=2874296 RepID=A0A8J2MPB9_9BILA|nr:unnamed protein product [Cercopithifilaria johnstoni]
MVWVVIMCASRKSEGKNLTKASKIVSMPEVRRFKLDLSGKQQQEVDVDFDIQFDDIGGGNEAPITTNATPKLVSMDVLQKTKRKSEQCKEDNKEGPTQSGSKRHRMSKKSIQRQQSGSRITERLQKKQYEEPIKGNEVPFFCLIII